MQPINTPISITNHTINQSQLSSPLSQQLLSQHCISFYNILASQPQYLQNGYEYVHEYLTRSSQNRSDTLTNLFHPTVPVLTLCMRTYPVVFGGNDIQRDNITTCNKKEPISEEQKQKTRQYLVLQVLCKQILIKNDNESDSNQSHQSTIKKKLSKFLPFLIGFHNIEGYDAWVGLYQQMLTQLLHAINNQNQHHHHQYISYILIHLLKHSDDRVNTFSRHILPLIINLNNQQHQQPQQSNQTLTTQQNSLQIIYYCIRSMAFMNGTDDQIINQYVKPYIQNLLVYIGQSMSKSVKMMKYGLKILTILTAEYSDNLDNMLEESGIVSKVKQMGILLIGEFFKTSLGLDVKSEGAIENSHQQQDKQWQSSSDDDDDDQDNNPSHNNHNPTKKSSRLSLTSIMYQLLSLFQAFLQDQQITFSDPDTQQLLIKVPLVSIILSVNQYKHYNNNPEMYLVDIQDQGQKTLRNRAIGFLLQILESPPTNKQQKKAHSKLQQQLFSVCNWGLGADTNKAEQIVKMFLFAQKVAITNNLQIQPQQLTILFEESLMYLLYSLTEQILNTNPKIIQKTTQSLIIRLSDIVKQSTSMHVSKIAALTLLNKLAKDMKGQQHIKAYFLFILQQVNNIQDYKKEIGTVMALIRGIAYCSKKVKIEIKDEQGQARERKPAEQLDRQNPGIPTKLIKNLLQLLLLQGADNNSNNSTLLQESSHLILEFLARIIQQQPLTPTQTSIQHSTTISSLFPTSIQSKLLSKFIHDGMIAPYVIAILTRIGSQELINSAFSEYSKGGITNDNITVLLSEWIKVYKLTLSDSDVLRLFGVGYSPGFLAVLVKEYLKTLSRTNCNNSGSNPNPNHCSLNPNLLATLHTQIQPSWILPMLSTNLLQQPQLLFLQSISKITNPSMTSQYEIQNELLLPFYVLLKDTTSAIKYITDQGSTQLYQHFMSKLIQYAPLFQGSVLKSVTTRVLLNVAELDSSKIIKVLEVLERYGDQNFNKIEVDEQWDDEDEDDGQDQQWLEGNKPTISSNSNNNDKNKSTNNINNGINSFIDKMFDLKLVNDDVENEFAEVFNNVKNFSYNDGDEQSIRSRLESLKAKVKV